MIFVVVRGSFSELFWSIFDAHLHSKVAFCVKEAFISYIGGQKKHFTLIKSVQRYKKKPMVRGSAFFSSESRFF